jgi:hypothetical protein
MLLPLIQLEQAQILGDCHIRRPADESRESLNLTQVIILRLLADAADRHVVAHALEKKADVFVSHEMLLS